jgi:hypothetical protein
VLRRRDGTVHAEPLDPRGSPWRGERPRGPEVGPVAGAGLPP